MFVPSAYPVAQCGISPLTPQCYVGRVEGEAGPTAGPSPGKPRRRMGQRHAPQGTPGQRHAPQGTPGQRHAPQGTPGQRHAPQGTPGQRHAPQGTPAGILLGAC